MLKQSSIRILMLVHELEKTLGRLYTMFAEQFPRRGNIWNILINDENEHAESVRRLYGMTYRDEASFDERNIKADAVESIISYLKGVCDAARRGKISELQAVSIACDAEKSLIEKDIFTYFSVATPYADMLRKLHEGTMSHIQLTQNALDELRKQEADKQTENFFRRFSLQTGEALLSLHHGQRIRKRSV